MNSPWKVKTHPRCLEIHLDSHYWIFSAIAELIDNARDARTSEQFYTPEVNDDPKYLVLEIDTREINSKTMPSLIKSKRSMSLRHSMDQHAYI